MTAKKQVLLSSLLLFSVLVNAQLNSFFVKPIITEPSYTAAQDSHFVAFNTSVEALGKLLVFLPGTGALTKHYLQFPTLAANLGYHCINLSYPNAESAASACASSLNTDCYTQFREEVCFGTSVSAETNVDSLNSINTRLIKLLAYLANQYPSQGWEHYLQSDTVNWDLLTLGGHSQGSGHALYLSKVRAIDRVTLFAGPQDYAYFYSEPANWLSSEGLTDTSRIYSFLHLNDEVSSYAIQYQALEKMGLLFQSDSVCIDNNPTPFNYSRCLYTKATPKNSQFTGAFHNSPVVDFYTPAGSGGSLFLPVWEYMLSNSTSTSVLEIDKLNGFSYFPNPAQDIIQLKINSPKQPTSIKIVNLLGETVLETNVSGSLVSVNLAKLKPGIYTLTVAGCSKLLVIN